MTTVNMIILCILGVAIIYGYGKGLFGIVKVIISLIGAKLLYPVLFNVVNGFGPTEKFTSLIREFLINNSPDIIRDTEFGLDKIEKISVSVGTTISQVISFVIIYIAIRWILRFIFKLLTPRMKVIKTIDKIAGMILSVFVVILLGKFSYNIAVNLSDNGVQAATTYRIQIEESWVGTMYSQDTLFWKGVEQHAEE